MKLNLKKKHKLGKKMKRKIESNIPLNNYKLNFQ
jgi:hypothetical protein